MIEILTALVVVPLAYWLPGAAFASLFDWRDAGRLARLFGPFALSIVVTPVMLVLPAAVFPYHPDLLILAAFSAALFLAGRLLARAGRRPVLTLRPQSEDPAGRREFLLGCLFLGFVAMLAMVPRLHLFIFGSEVNSTGISDIYWHLAELTSIARSGLPPQHFMFPDVPLVYYYWSWMYPAVLASLSPLGDSLMRLLNLHVLVNLLAFFGVLWFFLRANLHTAGSRAFALIFLTLAGGFDFYTNPNLFSHEWWQMHSPALVSQVQIASPLTSWIWVPQHTAGALAFLLLLTVWRNLRGSPMVRSALAMLLAAFLFGTSAFVFLSTAVAGLVWVVLYRRTLFRRRMILPGIGLALLFLALAGPQIALAITQSGSVRWGEFRVVLFEAASGTNYARFVILDQILTILALPVVASVLLIIETGLPFALFAVWFFRRTGAQNPPWFRFLAWYPVLYLPFAFLLLAPNFSMRGMIPVQIVFVLAAALVYEELTRATWTGLQKAILRYGLAVIVLAQMVSPAVEWYSLARGALSQVLRPAEGILALPLRADAVADEDTHLIPRYPKTVNSREYINWANRNLPANAVVVETPLPLNYNYIHLLERMRFEDPAEVAAIPNGGRDLTLVNPVRLSNWWDSLGSGTLVEKALRATARQSNWAPVYLIVHGSAEKCPDDPVYQDSYTTICILRDGNSASGEDLP